MIATDPTAGRLEELERELAALAAARELPVPPYPAVALRVQQLIAGGDFGLVDLSRLVGADAALAARVTRCANSAFYGRGSPAVDLTQAISRVGTHQVARLALAASLASQSQAAGPLLPLRRLVWLEGMAAAAVSQELARLWRLPPEEAFLAGLLHDFGKLVGCAGLELLLERAAPRQALSPAALLALLERQHLALGERVAESWSLPGSLREVMTGHHRPASQAGPPSLLDLVRVADAVVAHLANGCHVGPDDLAAVPRLAREEERTAVAAVIEALPAMVAALDGPEEAPARRGPTRVRLEPVTGPPGRAIRLPVTVHLSRPRPYTAEAISAGGLRLTGAEPLPENVLVEATIHGPSLPFQVWGLASALGSGGGGYQGELHPFALRGIERMLWNQLVAGEGPEPARAG